MKGINKNRSKGIISVFLAMTMVAACFASACGGGETPVENNSTTKKYNEESDPLIFSIGELDGVFNPYFSTSAYDGEIAGMTQISMLSYNKNGQLTYGQDEPVMTLDFKQTMYVGDTVTTDGNEATSTVYEFLIKNGVKDSTGADLTIKDVLFNLYVYLDPLYNGSSTMYSTKIVGLDEYRTGGYTLDVLNTTANNRATAMMTTLAEYAKYKNKDDNSYAGAGTSDEAVQEQYIQQLYDYIDEMAEEDWTSAKNGVEDANVSYILVDNEDYKTNKISTKTYDITQPWEVFFIEEGMCQFVEINGKSKTEEIESDDPDLAQAPRYYVLLDGGLVAEMEEKLAGLTGDALIDKQYEICMNAMQSFKTYSQVNNMLYGSSVYTKMLDYFMDIAKQELLSSDDVAQVSSIEGITTYKVKAGETFNGTTYAMEHDVLRIEIEGIDPKAVWNFAFSVAPMHYYSSEEEIALFDGVEHFGVKKGNKDFRDNVLKASDKIGLPVGAGTYMASKATGGVATSRTEFKSNNVVYFERNPYFYTLGVDSATVKSEEELNRGNDDSSAIHNAYIKYLRYQIITSSNIMDAMISGQIDYSSEISATLANTTTLNYYKELGQLNYELQDNNGYGYVGINPKYVPDIEVRRIIMLALDRDIITSNYYTNGLGTIIERSMTTNSWAYPTPKPGPYYTIQWFIDHYKEEGYAGAANMSADDYLIAGTEDQYDLVTFMSDALTKVLGYSMSGDCLSKKLADGKTYKLDYTFTIAGDTKDHPAYSMFIQAASDLGEVGMKIAVKTDVNALSKLANGSLAVWAAAWSSAIDPDMYQVYHKNSQATSVNNWGYNVILNDSTGLYDTEKEIINRLSIAIDEGRSYLEDEERKDAYSIALDLVMELAVELPTYQRVNLLVYNSAKIDASSLNVTDLTAYSGLIDKIWEIKYL